MNNRDTHCLLTTNDEYNPALDWAPHEKLRAVLKQLDIALRFGSVMYLSYPSFNLL